LIGVATSPATVMVSAIGTSLFGAPSWDGARVVVPETFPGAVRPGWRADGHGRAAASGSGENPHPVRRWRMRCAGAAGSPPRAQCSRNSGHSDPGARAACSALLATSSEG
jgi:hypothetical protein